MLTFCEVNKSRNYVWIFIHRFLNITFLCSLTLRLGEWDIEQHEDCDGDGNCNPKVILAKVERRIIHPEYKRKDKINDIALIRMKQALSKTYYSHILPICMPFSTELMHESFNNVIVSVVGWGLNENGILHLFKIQAIILIRFLLLLF